MSSSRKSTLITQFLDSTPSFFSLSVSFAQSLSALRLGVPGGRKETCPSQYPGQSTSQTVQRQRGQRATWGQSGRVFHEPAEEPKSTCMRNKHQWGGGWEHGGALVALYYFFFSGGGKAREPMRWCKQITLACARSASATLGLPPSSRRVYPTRTLTPPMPSHLPQH